MVDLVTWINQTAGLLIDELPLQTIENSIALVESWLSDVGGWLPTVQQNPNGDGQPANGFTEQQAAEAITTAQTNAVYDLNFTVGVTLDVQMSDKLTSGLGLSAAANSMSNQVIAFLTNTINNSNLPIRLNSVGTQTPVSNRSDLSGYTTQAIRQAVNSDIAGPDKLVDYKAMTLQYARTTYGLDTTWNITSLYTETNQPIAILIKKYTNSTYATLDGGSTRTYVLTISPETYVIVSGVILG